VRLPRPPFHVRSLLRSCAGDLRRHDVPLAAAGLTFYALVALLPLLLVALWLAGLLLGRHDVTSLGNTLAGVVGTHHGLDRGVRRLIDAGVSARPAALVTAVLIAGLYGEGFARAFGRLSGSDKAKAFRGRLAAVLLIALTGVLLTGGLLLTRWLVDALGNGAGYRVLGVYLAFLVCWGGATQNVALCYRTFGPRQLTTSGLWWGAAGAGSWIAGSALGFLLVLSLPLSLGPAFAGSDAVGAAALLAFWLYFSHIAVLLGYSAAIHLGEDRSSSRSPTRLSAWRRRRPGYSSR
jgi:membrane protein